MPRVDIDFEELLQNAAEAAIVVDRQGIMVWVNRRAEVLFHFAAGTMLGQCVDILVPEGRRSLHAAHRQTFADDPRNRPMGRGLELQGCRRDGTIFPVEISLSHRNGGDDLLVMALIADVSERRVLEEKLAEEERRRRRTTEEEQAFFARLKQPPQGALTAAESIRQRAPEIFDDLRLEYRRILENTLQRRLYKEDSDLSGRLRKFARRLSVLQIDPRDLVELHTAGLRDACENATVPEARAFLEEGRLLLVELMGHLVTHYRKCALETGPSGERHQGR